MPGVLPFRCASGEQRARGSRAPTAPAVPCAEVRSKSAHGLNHEYSQDSPAFPAQWFTAYFVLFPVSGVCCHRCRARTGGPDRRHGRGARTTRLRRPRFGVSPGGKTRRNASPRPSHPAPNVSWRRATPLLRSTGREIYTYDLHNSQAMF